MSKRIMLEQNTLPWHEYRRNHIGSSEIASIMGIGFKTPYALWEEKLGLREQEEPNEAMKRGSTMEVEALQAYNEFIKPCVMIPAVFESEIYPFMSASIDGVCFFEDVIATAIEVKCCGPINHARLLQGDIMDYYIAQMQWQMNILELNTMILYAYSPTSSKAIVVERDQEYIYKMIEKATEFWECVTSKVPPPLTEKDYPVKEGLEWSMTVSTWKDAKAMLTYYEAKEAELRQELIKQAEGSNARGCGIKLTKVIRSGNIDYPKMIAAMNFEEEAEKYRKESSTSFRITTEKD